MSYILSGQFWKHKSQFLFRFLAESTWSKGLNTRAASRPTLSAALFSTPACGEENGSEEAKHEWLWVCLRCFHFLTFVTCYYFMHNAR